MVTVPKLALAKFMHCFVGNTRQELRPVCVVGTYFVASCYALVGNPRNLSAIILRKISMRTARHSSNSAVFQLGVAVGARGETQRRSWLYPYIHAPNQADPIFVPSALVRGLYRLFYVLTN